MWPLGGHVGTAAGELPDFFGEILMAKNSGCFLKKQVGWGQLQVELDGRRCCRRCGSVHHWCQLDQVASLQEEAQRMGGSAARRWRQTRTLILRRG